MSKARTGEQVLLTLRYEREGNRWVGTCLELGTSTFARTLSRCQAELEDLVSQHLDVLEETGERGHFFKKHDIPTYSSKASPRTVVIREASSEGNGLFQDALFQPKLFPLTASPHHARQLATA